MATGTMTMSARSTIRRLTASALLSLTVLSLGLGGFAARTSPAADTRWNARLAKLDPLVIVAVWADVVQSLDRTIKIAVFKP